MSYEKAAAKVRSGVDKLSEEEIKQFENKWKKITDYAFLSQD